MHVKLGRNKKVCPGRAWFRRFVDQDSGVTSSEYGTILAVVIITVMVSISTLGGKVSTTVSNVGAELPVAGAADASGGAGGDAAEGGAKGNGRGRGAGQGGGRGSGRGGGGGRSQGKGRG